jgi:hypothetical protein
MSSFGGKPVAQWLTTRHSLTRDPGVLPMTIRTWQWRDSTQPAANAGATAFPQGDSTRKAFKNQRLRQRTRENYQKAAAPYYHC